MLNSEEKEKVKLSDKQMEMRKKVQEKQNTPEFEEEMRKQGLKKNDNGRYEPIHFERKKELAEKGSGKKTRVFKEDGTLHFEKDPNDHDYDDVMKKYADEEARTNESRKRSATIVNFQLGDEDGNEYYEEMRAKQQALKKKNIVKIKKPNPNPNNSTTALPE